MNKISENDFIVVNHKNGKKYDGRVVMVRNTKRGFLFTVAVNDYSVGMVKYRSLYLDDCVSCLKIEDCGFVSVG